MTNRPLRMEGHSLFAGPSEAFIYVVAPYALLIVAVFLAYGNVYGNDFVFDDLSLITDNKFLTSWHYIGTLFVTHIMQGSGSASAFYRPLQMLLYLIAYQIAGPSTAAFHFLNIVLHVINACLLYRLGVKLGFHHVAAFFATLLWAVHPVQTEAVTCMGGTADPLCGVFLLTGIVTLAQDFNRRNTLIACCCFLLALLSKETAIVFPALVMGLIFYRSEKRWSPRTYLKTWPFWLMAALYFLARETVLNFNGFLGYYIAGASADVTMLDRITTFLATLPAYLQLLLWPVGLHMERSFPIYHLVWSGLGHSFSLPPQVIAGFVILGNWLIGIVWKPTRRATPLAWGLLWAAIIHFPQSGIVVPNDALISEHWLYLPMMGLSLGLGESLARLSMCVRQFQPILIGLMVAIAGVLGLMTFQQNEVWQDTVTFYNHIFDCGENSIKARTMLGNAYAEKEQYTLAIDQYRRALAVSDDVAEVHYNLGVVLLSSDGSEAAVTEAIHHFERALEINPDYYTVDDTLASVYASLGDKVKAQEYRRRSAAVKKKLEAQ